MQPSYARAFAMGVRAAEHVHGISNKEKHADIWNELRKAVWETAEGTLSLQPSPEEYGNNIPEIPPEVLESVPDAKEIAAAYAAELARSNRPIVQRLERELATIIVKEWEQAGLRRPL